jgi:predicted DNA-binding transcriptional regulator AlpA
MIADKNSPLMFNVKRLAEKLALSPSSVRRLSEKGKMPPPIGLGKSKRWIAVEIESWIDQGCPTVRNWRKP